MIGGSNNSDLSKYLINFNASDWANQANAHLQQALGQGLNYSQANNQQATNALQAYNQSAQNQMVQGFQQAQQLNAPQRQAAYNALNAYQADLGLPTYGTTSSANSGLLTPNPNLPMSIASPVQNQIAQSSPPVAVSSPTQTQPGNPNLPMSLSIPVPTTSSAGRDLAGLGQSSPGSYQMQPGNPNLPMMSLFNG